MSYRLRIADLPSSERPRERLLESGAQHLSTAELIAILLGTGQGKGKLSAVGLAQHILKELSEDQRDPLDVLRNITPQELMMIPGVGPAKATTIVAGLELGKRSYQTRPNERTVIDNPSTAAAILSHKLMWQDREHFAVLLLDSTHRLIATKVLTVGTANQTQVYPRDVFREVIRHNAAKFIVAHNHPSGILEPSQSDLILTQQLLQGAQYLEIPLVDHLILGNGTYQSIQEISPLWIQYPQEEDNLER